MRQQSPKTLYILLFCSETELEELLTQYTKMNKNASVFLGGKELNTSVCHSRDVGLSRQGEGLKRLVSISQDRSINQINLIG